MSYATLKAQFGRFPVTIVEMELGFCGNTYGVAPCTASAGSGNECYNCFAGCQDVPNYTASTKTYKFITENLSNLPAGLDLFPCVQSISLAPTKLEQGGLGQRASVTVKMRDFPHHDRGIDPYVSTRTYDTNQGSFFGKLRARNKYFVNRKLTIKTGYIDTENGFDMTLSSDFQSREYFIERLELDERSGTVSVVAKDVLKFADNKRAEVPVKSDGVLLTDIDDSQTTGIYLRKDYTTTYPSSGYIRINDEIIQYTAIDSNDQFTGVIRARFNTTADSHSAEDVVQECLYYEEQTIPDVLEDLLVNYADVDASYITSATWDAEYDAKAASTRLTGIISEPKGVKDLIEEVLDQTLSMIWWDEVTQQIKFKVIFPVDQRNPPNVYTDDNILDGSFSAKEQEKLRLSQIYYYYGQIDASRNIDEKDNYQVVQAIIDTDAESANAYGSSAIKEIFARFIDYKGAALEATGRLRRLYVDTPREIYFKLDAKDSDLQTGDIMQLDSRFLQDDTGANFKQYFLVTKKLEREQGHVYEYTALEYNFNARIAYIGPNTLNDYNVESAANKTNYGFISDNNAEMSDGTSAYVIG